MTTSKYHHHLCKLIPSIYVHLQEWRKDTSVAEKEYVNDDCLSFLKTRPSDSRNWIVSGRHVSFRNDSFSLTPTHLIFETCLKTPKRTSTDTTIEEVKIRKRKLKIKVGVETP